MTEDVLGITGKKTDKSSKPSTKPTTNPTTSAEKPPVPEKPKKPCLSVHITGEIYIPDTTMKTGKTTLVFDRVVKIPVIYNIKSVLRSTIMPSVFRKEYPGFVRIRTLEIQNITPEGGAQLDFDLLTLPNMGKSLLTKYIALKKLPVDAGKYPTVTELRQAIITAEEAPAKFIERDKAQTHKIDLLAAFNELNS